MARIVSIARFKARLSEYLSAVRAGEEVLVTDRGQPVARLVPLGATRSQEARLTELVRAGLVREPGAPLPPGFLGEARPRDPTGRSLEVVLEERAEAP